MKNKHLLLVSLSAVMAVGVISTICAKGGLSNIFADEAEVTYKHYKSIAPTSSNAGIKEYWVSCNDDSHVFSEPTGSHVTIEEGEWTEAKIESVLALNDDRKINAGDFEGYLYQSQHHFASLLNIPFDAEVTLDDNHAASFRAGEDNGSVEAGVYVPPHKEDGTTVDDNRAQFAFRNTLLKAAQDFGYGYMVFTVQAESIFSEYGFLANKYAMTSGGEADWTINYSELACDLENGASFCVDLSAYDFDTAPNACLNFLIRNTAYPSNNTVVSDVTLSNIGFTNVNYMKDVGVQMAPESTVVYSVNDEGLIDEMQVRTHAASKFNTTVGLARPLFESSFNMGYREIQVGFDWSDNVSNLYYHKVIDTNAVPKESFSRETSLYIATETTANIYVGFPNDGGASQNDGVVNMTFKYNPKLHSDLYERPYNSDNAKHLFGMDCALHGTVENGSSGSGGVGQASYNGEAASNKGITLYYANGQNTGKQAMFFRNNLHIVNYSPTEGDVVVFHAGLFQDPTNTFDVNRIFTLDKDVTYYYNGEFFEEVNSKAHAREVLDILWSNKTLIVSGAGSMAALMPMAGYDSVSFHVDIASLYSPTCEGLSNFRLVPTFVTDKGYDYGYQKNGIGESGADLTFAFSTVLTRKAATSISNIAFTVRCWHDSTQDLDGHTNEGTGCWGNLGSNIIVSNVTFAE